MMNTTSPSVLVLFDFDGTITLNDSLPDFIQFAIGMSRFLLGLLVLSPGLLLYKIRVLSNDTAKQTLISYYFKGWNEVKCSKHCRSIFIDSNQKKSPKRGH